MSDPLTTDQRVLVDLLERIDKLTNHIIEIKGEMYKRIDWQGDSQRIYDHIDAIQTQVLMSLREAIGENLRRMETIEKGYAPNEEVLHIREIISQMVPRSEHMQRWENDSKQIASFTSRLALVEKRALPAFLVASVGTIAGALLSYFLQSMIHAASH